MNCKFSERFLQILWNERLISVRASTTDRRAVRVLSTGIWNRCAGPDFSNAAVLLDNELCRGDIEVHRYASEWFTHGHDNDPRYNQVCLHVVWQNDLPPDAPHQTALPTLELSHCLQRGWRQVLEQVEAAFYPHAREVPPGSCAMRWALTDDAALSGILESAGSARFMRRGAQILRESALSDIDQVLYEHFFDALGYSANRQQFRALAQAVPLSALRQCDNYEMAGAILFGTAGLLPDSTRSDIVPQLQPWVRDAWHYWWQSGRQIVNITWNPSGSRPLNSIFRRLAGGLFWLKQCNFAPRQWLAQCLAHAEGKPAQLLRALSKCAPEETPWQQCYDFHRLSAQPAALLGSSRLTDIVTNIWLPYLAAQAECARDEVALQLTHDAMKLLPRQHSNLLLDEACHRFLTPPSREKQILRHAIQQQGMMDIYQKFCLALNHDCNECPFVCNGTQ
jgi:hypothetical protein